MQPFSITLFATSGDPGGIRHLDKSNWSGYGVVFNKELFHLLKQEPGFSQAGIYILVGNAAEETIYIGEADPVGDRLKNHVSTYEEEMGRLGKDWRRVFAQRAREQKMIDKLGLVLPEEQNSMNAASGSPRSPDNQDKDNKTETDNDDE